MSRKNSNREFRITEKHPDKTNQCPSKPLCFSRLKMEPAGGFEPPTY